MGDSGRDLYAARFLSKYIVRGVEAGRCFSPM